MSKIYYDLPPELEEQTLYECGIGGCSACLLFDDGAHEYLPCANHGFTWVKVVRQFENGKMISKFKEKLDEQTLRQDTKNP